MIHSPAPVLPGDLSDSADHSDLSSDAIAHLRLDLTAANYTVDGVQAVLGDLANEALHREQSVPALRALAGNNSATATLIRLFILGQSLPLATVSAVFGHLTMDGAQALNLVVTNNDLGTVTALVEIRPHGAADQGGSVDWWLTSDLGEVATGGALQSDHVLGAGGASLTLAQVTARTPVNRVLDVGTGSGIQALYAARHAQEIVATDLSERALGFARFNAALNMVTFDLRGGSMLEPVTGETFDLIVSNPPFVITPRTEGQDVLPQYEYRDGGAAGDEIVHNLIVDLGGALNRGGSAYVLGNWEIKTGQPWTQRITGWLDEATEAHGPLDAWVIQRELLDPAQYAETWIRDGGTTPDRDPAGYAATYGAWLTDFESRDVAAIGFGIMVLRKPLDPQNPTIRRLEEITGTVAQPLGPVFAASLAAHDLVSTLTDHELGNQHLVVAPDVTEERFYTPGQEDPNIIILRQGSGLGRTIQATTVLAGLVGACDGELSVGQIIAAIATLFEVSTADLTAELMADVRGLITDGLLTLRDGVNP